MARTKGTVEGIAGKVSLGRQVEFFVQLFGWDEERIVAALTAVDPEISDPERVRNLRNLIRVTRSKFKSDTQESDMEK
jgi:hypothetical protein